jgi:hypothetical protein
MPRTPAIDISTDILSFLVSATEEVFEMMVFRTLQRFPAISADHERPPAQVVASVAFVGHRRGYVALHSTLATARRITGAMLGMPVDAIGKGNARRYRRSRQHGRRHVPQQAGGG